MAINTFPAVASPVKSVQRGSAAGAGTVTITSVDIAKSMVNIFGTTSSGTVAASAAVNAPSGNIAATTITGSTLGMKNIQYGAGQSGNPNGTLTWNAAALSLNAQNLTG